MKINKYVCMTAAALMFFTSYGCAGKHQKASENYSEGLEVLNNTFNGGMNGGLENLVIEVEKDNISDEFVQNIRKQDIFSGVLKVENLPEGQTSASGQKIVSWEKKIYSGNELANLTDSQIKEMAVKQIESEFERKLKDIDLNKNLNNLKDNDMKKIVGLYLLGVYESGVGAEVGFKPSPEWYNKGKFALSKEEKVDYVLDEFNQYNAAIKNKMMNHYAEQMVNKERSKEKILVKLVDSGKLALVLYGYRQTHSGGGSGDDTPDEPKGNQINNGGSWGASDAIDSNVTGVPGGAVNNVIDTIKYIDDIGF